MSYLGTNRDWAGWIIQAVSQIGHPIRDGMLDKIIQVTVWMSNPWLGWDIQSVTVGCPWRDWTLFKIIPSKSRFGCPIPSKSWIGLDDFNNQPILSWMGRPTNDTTWMVSKNHPSPLLVWTANLWHPTVTDWTSHPSHRLVIQTVILWSIPFCHGLDILWHYMDDSSSLVTVWTANPWQAWMIVQTVIYICLGLDGVQTETVWTKLHIWFVA